jgi:hypothetical protein
MALNERWPRLVDGFRASGALLILVAPEDLNVARALAQHADVSRSLVQRGDEFALDPLFPVRASLPPADAAPAPPVDATTGAENVGESSDKAMPVAESPSTDVVPVDDEDRSGARTSFAPLVTQRRTSRREFHIAVASIAIVMTFGALVLFKFLPRNTATDASAASAGFGKDVEVNPTADTVVVPAVVNPADAQNAAEWAVELEATNDRTDANLRLARTGAVAAKTVTLVSFGDDPAPWYKIVVGAFSDRSGAELLRSMMRRTGTLDGDAGVVARVPYALRLDAGLTQSAARSQAEAYAARGIAAYALVGDDGHAAVYTGAFASPEQAVLLIAELRAHNVESVLAYRIGRTY